MISGSRTRARASPRPLAHAAGDLAGKLGLRAEQAHHVHLLHDDVTDFFLALLGVLAQREGDVVVEAHRAEQRAVLEQDTEELAHLIEVRFAQLREVATVDDDRAAVGP
jgi:hypothetical protein